MALITEIDDSDERFLHVKTTSNPIIINDISTVDYSDINVFDTVVNTSDKNVLSSAPTCHCGACVGLDRLGDICPDCQSQVQESTQTGYTEDVWIRAPGKVPSLLSPAFLASLVKAFIKKNPKDQCIVSWVLNSQARPSKETAQMQLWRDEYKMQRGLTYFINNFDHCMKVLYQIHGQNYETSSMRVMVQMYHKQIFPRHIPILGKSFIIVEKNATGAYTGQGISLIIDTINLIKGIDIDNDVIQANDKTIDSRAARALLNIVYYRLENMKLELFKKKSLVRQHVFGTRAHFTMRCVATSITEPHEYDVVRLPWGPSIAMLRLHITNRLMTRGYGPSQINTIINSSIHTFNPLISDVIDELMLMTHEGYFDILLLRNPTLGSGSIQRLKAVVKKDPFDYTISHPIMNVRLLNLDFDGDNETIALVLDDVTRKQTEILKPHYAGLEVTTYGQPSNAFEFPKPTASIIYNYLKDQNDLRIIDHETLNYLEAI